MEIREAIRQPDLGVSQVTDMDVSNLPLADAPALKEGVRGLRAIVRNIAFIFASFLASWIVSLVFWLVVPRAIGPGAWGELQVGIAVSGIAFSIGGFGITTFLVKQISRLRADAPQYVAAGIATHLALSVLISAGVITFASLGPYSDHTRQVIFLVAAVGVATFVVAPAFSALQALEKMRVASIVYGARQVATNFVAVSLALILKPDIRVLIAGMLAANIVVSVIQLGVTRRVVGSRVMFEPRLIRRLLAGGLPFWSTGIFLTIYVAIDSVLLSTLVSTREVGYYAPPVQIVSALGFLPAILTFAIFPALSSSFHSEIERLRQLTRVSLDVLISLGMPMSIGVALVGPIAINYVFGPAYEPSGPAMVILAFTVLPSYIATIAFYVIAAADRQRFWAYVMGAMAIANPLINLITIPYFQHAHGHGSIGAAVALLITDVTIAIAGLALMPRDCLRPVGPLLTITMRTAIATAAMAIPAWFLRDRFLGIPILVGVVVFVAAAFVLGVFRGEGYSEVFSILKLQLRSRFGRRNELRVTG